MTDYSAKAQTFAKGALLAALLGGLAACGAPETRDAPTATPDRTAEVDGSVPIVEDTVREPVLVSVYRVESGDLRAVRAESGFDVAYEGGRVILTPTLAQTDGEALPIFVPVNSELSSQLEGQPIRVVVEARGAAGSALNLNYSSTGAGNSGQTLFDLSNSFAEYTLDYDISERTDTGNDRIRMGYMAPEGSKPLEIKSVSIFTRS